MICICSVCSEQYLSNLSKMHRILGRSNVELRKQRKLERDVDELRQKLAQAEHKVEHQKVFMRNMHPIVSGVQRVVLTDRVTMLKLKTHCNQLGVDIKGPSYK